MRLLRFVTIGALSIAIAACSVHSPSSVISAPTLHEYVIQKGSATPNWATFSPKGSGGLYVDMVSGPDGNIWLAEANNERVVRLTMAGGVKFFSPSVPAGYMAFGADKKLYVANGDDGQIGTMTLAGVNNRYTTPSGDHPSGLTLGPDGNVWFAEASHVGKITPAGKITEYALLSVGNGADVITTGGDGNLWMGEYLASKIAKVTPAGKVTEYPITGGGGCNPHGIAKASDGNVWFRCGSDIGRITPGGVVTMITTPTVGQNSLPNLVQGPDGHPWYVDDGVGLHEIDPKTLQISDYTPPNSGFSNYTLATGRDGNVWVAASPNVVNVYIPNPLNVTPKSIAFTGPNQMKVVAVTEHGKSSWTATSSDTSVATVAPGPGASKFTVTSVATGKATVTVSDGVGNLFPVKVTVP